MPEQDEFDHRPSQGEFDRKPSLDESKFIRESYSSDPFPPWIWLAVIACIAAVLWGSANWFQQERTESIEKSPFLQVTNRQMSLFLWQFSEYMRPNVPVKEGYMPGFNYTEGKVSIIPGEAENIVAAPPEVIFLYHTWARLLKPETIVRTVTLDTFKEFLQVLPEWQPENWKDAPQSYKDLVANLDTIKADQFAAKSRSLPLEVEIALIGWLNYFKEGGQIDSTVPTYEEMEDFLERHPNYNRNFWRNIVYKTHPDYLIKIANGKFDPKAKVNPREIAGFLRVAFYNDKVAESQK
ncbi:MAG: hypothetical protein WC222_10995 [Parachlamydiales bacterium]|jgi:hypothetical protein